MARLLKCLITVLIAAPHFVAADPPAREAYPLVRALESLRSCRGHTRFQCGAIEVPTRYDLGRPEMLRLSFMLSKNTGDTHKPILAMVPGGPGNSGHYLAQAEFMPELLRHFRVLIMHPRGSIPSPIRDTDLFDTQVNNVRAFARDLEQLRAFTSRGKGIFVYGHSFGGITALVYSGWYPENTYGLISHSSLANYGGILQIHEEALTDTYVMFDRYRDRYADHADVELVEQLFKEAEVVASRGVFEVHLDSETWIVSRSDFRYVMSRSLAYPPGVVIPFLRGFISGDEDVKARFQEIWRWRRDHDNTRQRQFLTCSELLPEPALSRHVFNMVWQWRDELCPRTEIQRALPLSFAELARKVSDPVLIIQGKYDFVVPIEHANPGFQVFPRAVLAVIDRASHYSYNEQPEETARVIIDFARNPLRTTGP